MSTKLLSIGTAVPNGSLQQGRLRDFFASQPGIDSRTRRIITAAFDHSGIDRRHAAIDLLDDNSGQFTDADGKLLQPTTGERNSVYRKQAPLLFATASQQALRRAAMEPDEVTHVITASCTGFFAPGPEFRLVRDLGLRDTVERYHLGFMGCAAAFPALRAAKRICDAMPGAVALVACAELCSLHIRSSEDSEQIVSSAVFADGAAAAVVTSCESRDRTALLEVGAFSTATTSDGEADMDWDIGDSGFDMRLTPEVPRIVGREISGVVGSARGHDRVDAWAVHPGGKAVLDRVQQSLELSDHDMAASRAVLREFGNMSSATVLFILERILADDTLPHGASVFGVAFGPGLTVETAQFTRIGSP
ncbi:MAG TPA: type III polyketide synthase [Candidatus Agrococcus pullicola]|uniref:Type III polyketide synthase n=1 Tax=Candidatus Agrococcus pullicola TaxID=2838429 RepID=A0A9D2C806_9MICO|nr:type III polyketide synthase [Candidatus Agrococcus pullicola]